MGKNVSPAGHGEPLANIDDFRFVIPNSIRVRILPIHLRIGDLPDHDVVAERKYDFIWYSHRIPRCLPDERV